MKKDVLFKEMNRKDNVYLSERLDCGYFIVSSQYNSVTDTIDYHLRKTLLSWLMSKFK